MLRSISRRENADMALKRRKRRTTAEEEEEEKEEEDDRGRCVKV